MDIRNVQKSGTTYYVYLPASWCRQNNISTESKLTLEASSEGDLVLKPHGERPKTRDLTLNLHDQSMDVINKFIVASYLNPLKSFHIKLDKSVSSLEILDQKRNLSGIEIVEYGDRQITCESSVYIDDPDIMLKTMVKKIANMLHVVIKNGASALLERYEEEIDRSNTLITKSAIQSLMFHRTSRLRNIELFYIASLSKSLENFADQLPNLTSKPLQRECLSVVNLLLKTLDTLSIPASVAFSKAALRCCHNLGRTNGSQQLQMLISSLNHCADIIVDWTITKEIEPSR